MALTIQELAELAPANRRLSTLDAITDVGGIVLNISKKRKKERIVPFIVTSEHVDVDGEIDNIDSIAKQIPGMLNSERGVTLTLLHSDTITGKVYHLEKTTVGDIVKRYPDMADRLNVTSNESVKCIYGEAKLYQDTPVLDDAIWKMIQDGHLGAVSLRGVGKTIQHSNKCDIEGNCGKEVVDTKFWSVTLCRDGEQAKPYSAILKMRSDSMVKSKCGGTAAEVKAKDAKITELTAKIKELKTKMINEEPEVEEETPEEEVEEVAKMTCPKCGESFGNDSEQEKMDHTLVPNEQLAKLLDDSEQLRKMETAKKPSPMELRLNTHFSSKPMAKIKMQDIDIKELITKMVNEDPKALEALGFKKTRTPETKADTIDNPPEAEEVKTVSYNEIVTFYKKMKDRKPTPLEVIQHQIHELPLEA